jgi:hypothetical protein
LPSGDFPLNLGSTLDFVAELRGWRQAFAAVGMVLLAIGALGLKFFFSWRSLGAAALMFGLGLALFGVACSGADGAREEIGEHDG